MDIDLRPKFPVNLYEGDGGSYHAWCPDDLVMLRRGNIGGAKLSLQKHGFSPPYYSDSSKVVYVLQGNGVAGVILPKKDEKVIGIRRGDAIALPFGTVTWWYNKEDIKLVILFLGDTSKAHNAGSFTDFFLTGSNGIFTGFSNEFVSRAWDLDHNDVNTLVRSQTGRGPVKLDGTIKFPDPVKEHRDRLVYNCEEAPLDVDLKNGGRVVVLNTKNLPLVAEIGLGADLVQIDGGAIDSALQVTYIVSGSGRIQVVGAEGERVLDTTIEAGQLFIVPRLFVVSKIGDHEGMSWFSIVTTPDPIFTQLAGRTSVWKTLSAAVLEASFNVSSKVEKMFRTTRVPDEIFFPPQSK
ncbi:Glutelin type-D 1 [Linum perenne]